MSIQTELHDLWESIQWTINHHIKTVKEISTTYANETKEQELEKARNFAKGELNRLFGIADDELERGRKDAAAAMQKATPEYDWNKRAYYRQAVREKYGDNLGAIPEAYRRAVEKGNIELAEELRALGFGKGNATITRHLEQAVIETMPEETAKALNKIALINEIANRMNWIAHIAEASVENASWDWKAGGKPIVSDQEKQDPFYGIEGMAERNALRMIREHAAEAEV